MSARGRLTHLADLPIGAASGLVLRDDALFVVGDDGWWLGVFDRHGALVSRIALPGRPADMPLEAPAPKALKADHESLVLLPDGALVAFGSGSSPRRRAATWIAPTLDATRRVECSELSAALETIVAPLNLEGAALHGHALLLAQRATRGVGGALVLLDLALALREIGAGALTGRSLREVRPLALGALQGLPLSLTDLCAGPDGSIWFTAAAEDTSDPYVDGPCHGSVLGRFDAALRPADPVVPLAPVCKVEGLAFDAGERRWLMVADADDPTRPSPLFALPVIDPRP